MNVSIPEGLVSDAAYSCWTPPGKPFTATSAVSLVEVMLMFRLTGVPSWGTRIWEIETETVMVVGAGPGVFEELFPPPQPLRT
jgi:hypothetical protein